LPVLVCDKGPICHNFPCLQPAQKEEWRRIAKDISDTRFIFSFSTNMKHAAHQTEDIGRQSGTLSNLRFRFGCLRRFRTSHVLPRTELQRKFRDFFGRVPQPLPITRSSLQPILKNPLPRGVFWQLPTLFVPLQMTTSSPHLGVFSTPKVFAWAYVKGRAPSKSQHAIKYVECAVLRPKIKLEHKQTFLHSQGEHLLAKTPSLPHAAARIHPSSGEKA